MLKRTALYEEHLRSGGRMVDFGGWELPVQYTGVMDEHQACRSSVGIFDVSHMGEFHVEGPSAERFLDYLVTNQVSKLADGQAQYTVMCHANGGIVDDLVIYRRSRDRFLVVVNASNTEKDFEHTIQVARERFASDLEKKQLTITNESARYTQIAIQGRDAVKVLQSLTGTPLDSIKTYWFTEGTVLNSIPAVIARTGYTGEDGFEVYVPWDQGPELWRQMIETGSRYGLKPCGLGARDTLRLEMKYPLYGHELSDDTNPLEAGLGWVVKLAKEDFMGKAALVAIKEKGTTRQLVGFRMMDRGIPRQGYAVFDHEGREQVGIVTSGTQSPSLKQAVGIAYVAKPLVAVGTPLTIDIRGTKTTAEVIQTPFYSPTYLNR